MYDTNTVMDKETKTHRLWHIHFSLPQCEEKGRKYTVNRALCIGAETMSQALEEASKIEPNAIFWQINHGGILHVSV